jgi:hypothetical protein
VGIIKLELPQSDLKLDYSEYKIHGLALISEGFKTPNNDKEFVLVFVEVPGDNLISINELRIQDGHMPPYDFKYEMVEWREYTQRKFTSK